jgi:hypothetical protein
MRTIARVTFDSALCELAFSKSTLKCSCTRLRYCFTSSFHLAGNQSKLSLGHRDREVMSASIAFRLFLTSQERFNTHRTVAAQRFSSIHF